jgi:hypothetical protein
MAEESTTADPAEKNWVEEMAEDGWEVEYFYYGHMEGRYWRKRGDEYQYQLEVAVSGYAERPYPDVAENQVKIWDLLRYYSKGAQELELHWHDKTKTHAPAAWLHGWKPSTEEDYLRSRKGAWANPDGSHTVPSIFLERKDYEHSRAIEYSGPYSVAKHNKPQSLHTKLRWKLQNKLRNYSWGKKVNAQIQALRRCRGRLTRPLKDWNLNRRISMARGVTPKYWAPGSERTAQ